MIFSFPGPQERSWRSVPRVAVPVDHLRVEGRDREAEGQDAVWLLERQERAGFRKQENSGGIEGTARRIRHQLQRSNEAEVSKNNLALF